MQGFGTTTFGELNAEDYDETQDPGTTSQAVKLIAELAGAAPILEFAIGTGRIALPLAAAGCTVNGIEASDLMLDKMRAKPGGADIPVTIGDMATSRVDGAFGHVCLVFNTLFNLPDQAAQVQCFANAAAHLEPGGTFLVETFIPNFERYHDNQIMKTKRIDMSSFWFEGIQHDPTAQRLDFQRVRMTDRGTKLIPLTMRYAYPAEMDLMAQLAGLRLKHRWGNWDKAPFDASSQKHVSVWEKPA